MDLGRELRGTWLWGLRSRRKAPGFSRVRVMPSREGPAAKAASVAEARRRRSPAAASASVAAAVTLSPSYRPFTVAFIPACLGFSASFLGVSAAAAAAAGGTSKCLEVGPNNPLPLPLINGRPPLHFFSSFFFFEGIFPFLVAWVSSTNKSVFFVMDSVAHYLDTWTTFSYSPCLEPMTNLVTSCFQKEECAIYSKKKKREREKRACKDFDITRFNLSD